MVSAEGEYKDSLVHIKERYRNTLSVEVQVVLGGDSRKVEEKLMFKLSYDVSSQDSRESTPVYSCCEGAAST